MTTSKATQANKPDSARRPHHGGKVHHRHMATTPDPWMGWSAKQNWEGCSACRRISGRGWR